MINYERILKRTLLVTLAVMSTVLLIQEPAQAKKSYQIRRVEIHAYINSDGSMRIEEFRTYRFKGSYSWADYRLPISGFSRLTDFTMRDDEGPYRRGTADDRGTFTLEQTTDAFEIKWFYRARNETRTFILSYLLHDVVKSFPDVAELYYKFVGEGWDRTSHDVSVTVHLPEGAQRSDIRAWAHGPLEGEVRIVDSRTVVLNVSALPRRHYWEGRIVFPNALVPGLPKIGSSDRLDEIIAEETAWAQEANEARRLAREARAARNARWQFWSIVAVFVTLAAIVWWYQIYRRHGKPYPTNFRGTYFSDMPSDHPPALIAYFLQSRTVYGSAMVATIFDLARRDFLTIEEQKEIKDGFFGQREKTLFNMKLDRDKYEREGALLADFERSVIDFVFDELAGGGDQISMQEIAKSRSKTQKWFMKWRRQVKAAGMEVGFFDEAGGRNMRKGLFSAIGLLVLTIPAIYFAGPGAILLGITGLVLLIASLATKRVAKEFSEENAQWKALKRYLRKYEFSSSDSRGLIDRIGDYLVYGVILGLTSKRIKELTFHMPADSHGTIFPWYIYAHSGSSDMGAAFGEAVSSMVSVASSSLSSATGAGGGASAGAGAGGGGSGGGAG